MSSTAINERSTSPRSPQRLQATAEESDAVVFAEYTEKDDRLEDGTQAPSTCDVPAPEWFRRRPAFPVIEPIAPVARAQSDEFSLATALSWLRTSTGSASGVSFGIHVAVLMALSWVAFAHRRVDEPFTTVISEAELPPGSVSFTGVADLSEVLNGGSSNLSKLLSEPSPENLSPIFAPELSANATDLAGHGSSGTGQGTGDGTGDGFEGGTGFQFQMPKGGKAVQRGNFSAWTEPLDPMPGENYMIVIRMKIPTQTKILRVSDLSGSVIGSDRFELKIPIDRRHLDATVTERKGAIVPVKASDLLPIVDGHVQVMVRVPGAALRVRDTIEIRSKLLNESQRLEIVF